MDSILIFAYEQYYPAGGMNDLVARVDDSERDKTDEHGRLRKDILEQALQQAGAARNTFFEFVHVVHQHPDGSIRQVERWRIAPFEAGQRGPLKDGQVRGHLANFEPCPFPPDDYLVVTIR